MKNRGRLSLCIIIFLVVSGGILYYIRQDKEEIEQPVIKEEMIVTGTITAIEPSSITITTQDVMSQTFVITDAIKQGYESLYVQDKVEIQYVVDDAVPTLLAKKITLLQVHKSDIELLLDTMSIEEKVG